jgi:uncharacterized membrane protein (Fun14 family)
VKRTIVILIGLCILTGLFFLPAYGVYAAGEDTDREPGVISVNADAISEDAAAAEENIGNTADDLIRETRRAPFLGLAAVAAGGVIALFIIKAKNRDEGDDYGEDE